MKIYVRTMITVIKKCLKRLKVYRNVTTEENISKFCLLFSLSLFEKIDKVITLTNKDTITQTKRFSYIQNKNLLLILTMKKYHKVQSHCHYTGKYEYHLII